MTTLPEIIRAQLRKEYDEGRFTPTHNHAHNIGGACMRELVYDRTKPELRLEHDDRTVSIFKTGKEFAESVKRILFNAGRELYGTEKHVFWAAQNLSGRIDGKDLRERKELPVEIKSITTYNYDKLNKAEDFVKDYDEFKAAETFEEREKWLAKQPYYATHLIQLLIYLYLQSEEVGIILMGNRDAGPGVTKEIVVKLYEWMDLLEHILQRCTRIEEHIKKGTLPEPINKQGYCDKYCQHFGHCGPTLTYGPEVEIVNDPELAETLWDRHQFQDYQQEYNKAHKLATAKFALPEGTDHARWIVNGSGLSWLVEAKRSKDGKKLLTFKNAED